MICLFQNITFSNGIFKVLVSPKERFFENFHRVDILVAFELAFENFAESTVAKKLNNIKGFEADS